MFLLLMYPAANLLHSSIWVESLLLQLVLSLLLLNIILFLHVTVEVIWSHSKLWSPGPLVVAHSLAIVHLILLQGYILTARCCSICELSNYRAIFAHPLLIIAIQKSSPTILGHEAPSPNTSGDIFHPNHRILACVDVHDVQFIGGWGCLTVVWTFGTTCPTHYSRCLGVVLAEVLKSLPEIAQKLRSVHSARLLLFPVWVIRDRSPGCSPGVKVVLLLKDVIATDSPLSLRGCGVAIFHVCASFLLARFILTHVLGCYLIILLLSVIDFLQVWRVLSDNSAVVPLSVIEGMVGFLFIILIFLINSVAIFNICCLRFVRRISLFWWLAAISIWLIAYIFIMTFAWKLVLQIYFLAGRRLLCWLLVWCTLVIEVLINPCDSILRWHLSQFLGVNSL